MSDQNKNQQTTHQNSTHPQQSEQSGKSKKKRKNRSAEQMQFSNRKPEANFEF